MILHLNTSVIIYSHAGKVCKYMQWKYGDKQKLERCLQETVVYLIKKRETWLSDHHQNYYRFKWNYSIENNNYTSGIRSHFFFSRNYFLAFCMIVHQSLMLTCQNLSSTFQKKKGKIIFTSRSVLWIRPYYPGCHKLTVHINPAARELWTWLELIGPSWFALGLSFLTYWPPFMPFTR